MTKAKKISDGTNDPKEALVNFFNHVKWAFGQSDNVEQGLTSPYLMNWNINTSLNEAQENFNNQADFFSEFMKNDLFQEVFDRKNFCNS